MADETEDAGAAEARERDRAERDRLVSLAEAGELVGRGVTTVRRWIRVGHIPSTLGPPPEGGGRRPQLVRVGDVLGYVSTATGPTEASQAGRPVGRTERTGGRPPGVDKLTAELAEARAEAAAARAEAEGQRARGDGLAMALDAAQGRAEAAERNAADLRETVADLRDRLDASAAELAALRDAVTGRGPGAEGSDRPRPRGLFGVRAAVSNILGGGR